jgi:hypothetical protein
METEKERHIKALDERHDKATTEQIACPVCGSPIQNADRETFNEKGMCSACNIALDTEED